MDIRQQNNTTATTASTRPSLLGHTTFRHALRRAVIWPVTTLVVALALLFALLMHLFHTARLADHSNAVLAQIWRVEKLAVDMETGVRGYGITGENVFLEPFLEASASFPGQLDTLDRLVARNTFQLDQARALRRAHVVWNDFAANVRHRVQANLPTDVDAHLRGKESMDTVRGHINSLQHYERRLLGEHARARSRLQVATLAAVALFIVILAPALVFSVRRALIRLNRSHEEALQAIRKERERFNFLTDASELGVWFCDLPFDELVWDDRVKQHFWLPPDARVTIDTFYERLHPKDREPTRAAISKAIADKTRYDIEYRTVSPDGCERWVRAIGHTHYDAQGKPVRFDGVTMDVTERKRAEEALRASEERYRSLFDSIDEGFCVIEMIFDERQRPVDYRFVEVNPAFERQAGMHGAVGKRMLEFVSSIEPHWLENYGRVALTGEPIRFADEYKSLRRWFDVYAFRVGDPASRRIAVIFNNITKRKEAEATVLRSRAALTAANEELALRARQLDETIEKRTAELRETVQQLETFSYSIVHDMRAPLRSMRSFAGFLHQRYTEKLDPPARDYVRRIMDSAARMDALITDVLTYSKVTRDAADLAPVDLDRLIPDVIEQYPNLQEMAHAIQIERPLPKVQGNSALLTQVFSNLLGNALKFVPPGRSPQVKVRAEPDHSSVRIWVEDNGVGVPPEHHERIFGLFQRLQRPEQYAGTGVGLAIVKRAVERMGGATGVDSDSGNGSRFWVDLPSANSRPPQLNLTTSLVAAQPTGSSPASPPC